tara:strand:+ start:611 stop:1762 length:1152 start_codon:yes stop_codon:yes gene_type:complete
MLQAVYKGTYTFYVSTEDRRYNTDVPTSQIRYLFKFTNNMDGRVVYAYGQDQVVYDRYTKVTFSHNTTEDVFLGRVNFVPNGYWNYKVYEVSSLASIGSLACATAPQTANGDTSSGIDTGNIGYYTITTPSGTVISTVQLTGKNDVYEGLKIDLDEGATGPPSSFYLIKLYNGCGALVRTGGWAQYTQVAQADNTRYAYVDNFKQTTTGITFDIVSNMPVGYSYDFYDNSSLGYVQITDITTKPQTTSHSFTQPTPFSVIQSLIEMHGYNTTGGAAGGGGSVWGSNVLEIHRISNPSTYYGLAESLYSTFISTDSGGTILSKGSAMFTVINGTTAASTTQGFYTLEGVVEEGKLYVSEPSGEEQVQYNQHPDPSGTNYIWYGQ